jgi:hypothetical protein
LTINSGGTLDINDNALILDYTGTSPAATIRGKIVEGRGGAGIGNGKWTGTGITSSTAREVNATMTELRSLGYAENAALPLGAYTTFRGQPVDATSILIAYTRTGDANLDGLVNDDDVTIVGATYAPGVPQPHWALGDFDYNGFVDGDDVTLLGAFYDPAAAPVPAPRQTGPEDRNVLAPVASATRLWRAVRPGDGASFNFERSGGPTRNAVRSAGRSDLQQHKTGVSPGPHGPGYSIAALRASESQQTRAVQRLDLFDVDLLDLLAETIALKKQRRTVFV